MCVVCIRLVAHVALGAFCLFQMQEIRNQGEAVESGSLPSIAMADGIAISLVKLRAESVRMIANADDPGAVVTSKINVETLKNDVEKGFTDYLAHVKDSTERDSLVALQDAYKAFIPALSDEIARSRQDKIEARIQSNNCLSRTDDDCRSLLREITSRTRPRCRRSQSIRPAQMIASCVGWALSGPCLLPGS